MLAGDREEVYKNASRAVQLLRLAAGAGCAEAQTTLGYCLISGIGTLRDKVEAIAWTRKAAEKDLPEAVYNLATYYQHGRGVKKDLAMAFKLFKKASKLGDVDADFVLGIFYLDGEAGEKDEGVARDYFLRVARKGRVRWVKAGLNESTHANAEYRLARMYDCGIGGAEPDHEEAFGWYLRAADQGHAKAALMLGNMYYHGRGTARSYPKSVECYHAAAKKENAWAMMNLGYCYYHGEGTERDAVEARKWIGRAAALGLTRAVDWLRDNPAEQH